MKLRLTMAWLFLEKTMTSSQNGTSRHAVIYQGFTLKKLMSKEVNVGAGSASSPAPPHTHTLPKVAYAKQSLKETRYNNIIYTVAT